MLHPVMLLELVRHLHPPLAVRFNSVLLHFYAGQLTTAMNLEAAAPGPAEGDGGAMRILIFEAVL